MEFWHIQLLIIYGFSFELVNHVREEFGWKGCLIASILKSSFYLYISDRGPFRPGGMYDLVMVDELWISVKCAGYAMSWSWRLYPTWSERIGKVGIIRKLETNIEDIWVCARAEGPTKCIHTFVVGIVVKTSGEKTRGRKAGENTCRCGGDT